MTAWAKYQAKHRRKLMREMNVGEVVHVKTKKEVLLRDGDDLRASPASCSWLATAISEWSDTSYYGPFIIELEGGLYLLSGEGQISQSIEFCPGCGRKLEVRDG